MGSKILCLAVLLIGMASKTPNATACPNPQTFGDNCEYQCHCAGGVACGTDGSCSNGCDSGWDGEYCQRGNAVARKPSSQSSTNGSHSSSLAIDGNTAQAFASCSHTNNENQPSWQVDLGRNYVLFSVTIWTMDETECKKTAKGADYKGTLNTTRNAFPCLDWLKAVHTYKPANSKNYCRNPDPDNDADAHEPWCFISNRKDIKYWDYCYVPSCQNKLKNFKILLNEEVCHHITGTVEFSQTAEIRCGTPVVGRYLKIQLMDSSTALTLCEVSVQAFQYRACKNKRYGPDCNNRCQCRHDDTCDDKTGKCPAGCNNYFTGPYCNIGTQTIQNDSSTPTSISVKWQFIHHNSVYDAGKVERLELIYNYTASSSSSYAVSYPRTGVISVNVTGLKPSTLYSFYVRVTYDISTGTAVTDIPKQIFRTASCADDIATPKITIQTNTIKGEGAWPNRVSLTIHAEAHVVIAECYEKFELYAKKARDSKYRKLPSANQRYVMHGLTAFTEYYIRATVTSPDGQKKDYLQKITTAEDVPSAPIIAKAGASPTSISIKLTPPEPTYGIITKYELVMWENGSLNDETIILGPTSLIHTVNNLELNITYNCKARAFTSYGGGQWTEVINIVTEENTGPTVAVVAEGQDLGLVAALVVGSLIVLALIITLVIFFLRRKRTENGEATGSLGTQLHDITSPNTVQEFENVEYEEPDALNEVIYDETSPTPVSIGGNLPRRIEDISVEDFKKWLLSKDVTESTYKRLEKNGFKKANLFAILQPEHIEKLRIKPLAQEALVPNLVKSFQQGDGSESNKIRKKPVGCEGGGEGAYEEIENPYAELNITHDVIASQTYAELKP